MNDRASVPGQHMIRFGAAYACETCQGYFDGSRWDNCPNCHSSVSVWRAPLTTIDALRENTTGAASTAPATNRTN